MNDATIYGTKVSRCVCETVPSAPNYKLCYVSKDDPYMPTKV